MNKRNISWEIVVVGLAFVGIGIFLFQRGDHPEQPPHPPHPNTDSASVPTAPAPPSFVIDLQNLQNLNNIRNLKNLKNLDNLESLEVELQHLDKLIDEKSNSAASHESTEFSVERALQQLERQIQKFEEGNFNIKLHDKKIFINRRYEVEEASWSETSPGVYVYRKTFDVGADEDMQLDLSFGNINIVGTDSEGGEIVLQATGDVNDSDRLNKNLLINITRNDNRSSLAVSSNQQPSISDRINLEATITVPRHTNFEANTAGGHISVNHLKGRQRLVTAGGHITLDDFDGAATAKTSGGHITGKQIDGDISLQTSGGHIKIEQASGLLKLRTGGGHITGKQISGEVNAKTSGGNISAEIDSLEGPLEFSTSAGNISLLLPRSINADITARCTQTSIDNSFNFQGTQTKGKIEGTINGGGAPITADCGYGAISIKTND